MGIDGYRRVFRTHVTINITLKVNLYFNEHFNGEEEYSYVDKPQLNFDNRALSLIGERLVDACR